MYTSQWFIKSVTQFKTVLLHAHTQTFPYKRQKNICLLMRPQITFCKIVMYSIQHAIISIKHWRLDLECKTSHSPAAYKQSWVSFYIRSCKEGKPSEIIHFHFQGYLNCYWDERKLVFILYDNSPTLHAKKRHFSTTRLMFKHANEKWCREIRPLYLYV